MARRLTVAQILPELHSGGVEKGTLEVNAELAARGQRSIVISAGGRLVEQVVAAGGEHFILPVARKSPTTLRSAWRLRSLLKELQVDILHARSRVPAWVSQAALRLLKPQERPRFVTTCHGLYSVNPYSRVMVSGERVIAISRTVQQYIEANYPSVDPGCIRLVHRGVSPAEFPHGYRPGDDWLRKWQLQYPQTRGRTIVTLPGRLTRYKGHHNFIEVIDRLRTRIPDVIGLIVGGEDPRRTDYADSVRQAVAARGLTNIILTGHRSDIRDVMAISDVVVSMSMHPPEAFGRTALEALSLGRPVVGFDDSGVGEVLAELFPDGRVRHGDVDQFTERTVQVLSERPRIPRNETFTLRRMLDRTLAVYTELTEAGPALERRAG